MCISEADSGIKGGYRCNSEQHAQRERRKAERAEKVFEEDPSEDNDEARKQAWLKYLETPAGIRELDARGKHDQAEKLRRRRERKSEQMKAFRAKNQGTKTTPSKTLTLAEKLVLAENPETPRDTQLKLGAQKNQKVQMVLARSSRDQEVLVNLASCEDDKVSALALQSPHMGAAALRSVFTMASGTGDATRQRRVAHHPACPADLYPHLAEVAPADIASKPDCPADILFSLSSSKFRHVRKAIASNPNIDVRAQKTLASDPDSNIRYSLAGNPAAETSILEQMRDEDPDFHPRNRAEQALAERVASLPA